MRLGYVAFRVIREAELRRVAFPGWSLGTRGMQLFRTCADQLGASSMVRHWSSFGNLPVGVSPDTMLLLTDGSVLVHHAYAKEWYRLTPNDQGQCDTQDAGLGHFP